MNNRPLADLSLTQVHNFLGQLKNQLGGLDAAGVNRSALEENIAAVEHELKKEEPNHSVIRAFLSEIRDIVNHVAENLIASGTINLLNILLGTGVPVVP